jgi:hypothetical protein
MIDQVQCPNCGGYKVNGEKETIKVKTYEPMPRTLAIRQAIGMFVFAAFLVFLAMITSATTVLLFCASGFVLFGLITLAPNAKISKEEIVGTVWHYNCLLCGYKWDWDTRTPKPEVQVRPDLIAKGEQKLEEERKRREEEYRHAGMWMNKK